jgi:UPF0271 protein
MAAIILDSTCFLQVWKLPDFGGELMTTPQVASEMKSAVAQARFAQAGMRIVSPKDASLQKAEKIGEKKLSSADLSVLALAIERKAQVATDDYALQNACRKAGVGFVPVTQKGISSEREYFFVCSGCLRVFPKQVGKCPDCGHAVKRIIHRNNSPEK